MAFESESGTVLEASRRRQYLIVAIVVLVVALGLALLWQIFRTAYEPLFTNLRTNDAATITAELDKRKIPYQLENGGATILVPSDQVDATRLSVMAEDLPLKGTVGFELFNESDMGLTDFAQRINYQRALQGELARTIMSLDEVESARVHLSLGERTLFRDDRVQPKASIVIKPKPGRALASDVVEGVQRLVAAAVPDLQPANVVVLGEQGQTVSAVPIAPEATVSPVAQQKLAIENYYGAQVRQALAQALPDRTLAVEVKADIPVATASGASSPQAEQWSPGQRNFALKVTIDPSKDPLGPLPPDENAVVITAASQAIALDAGKGDIVQFGTVTNVPPTMVEPTQTLLPPQFEPVAEADNIGPLNRISSATWVWALALLALLIIVAVLIVRNRGEPAKERRRASFAARLEALLEESSNASSSP